MFRSLCLFVFIVLASAKHEIYDGYALYEVTVQSADQVTLVYDIENQLDLDVWSDAIPGKPGFVLVPEDKKDAFENELSNNGIQFTIESENIKELLDLEEQLLEEASKNKSNSTRLALPFNQIYTYHQVDEFLEQLAAAYPQVVTLVNAGKSFEGRDIKYVKISSTNFQDSSKPVVFLESLLHAREWVTLPATLYAIHKLVIDVTEQDLIRDIDWIILPIANPDGYVHTHVEARFWRKNRATGYMIGNLCLGVDLNRNFDISWSEASSNSVCSETFHGSGPFSEPETAIIRDIFLEHQGRIELFLDIHSFGSMILYGYGTGQLPANALWVNLVGVQMAQAIDAVKTSWNPNYIVGNVALVLYQASGSAMDFAKAAGVPFAYTFELPGHRFGLGALGFLVDANFIEQAGFETWEVFGKHEEYKGYKVYNIHLKTQSQQDNFHELKSDVVDFWRKPSLKYNVTGKAMVPPSHFEFFESKLEKLDLPWDVYIEDVYAYLNEKERQFESGSRNIDDRYLNRYYRYDEILNHLRTINETGIIGTNQQLELVEYGVTDRNRSLVYLKITNVETKPVIVVEAGLNPREWITIPAALYILDKLMEVNNINLLNEYDWIIIPVLNPDGYEYTHTNLRLWSKTLSTHSHLGFICPGVNLDRNFDLDWLHFDSSSSPCSNLYAGIEPFSEIETQMVRHLLEDFGSRMRLYVSLQNAGGFITYPWNYERAASGMFRENHLLAIDMVESMREKYEIDAGSLVFDRSSGTSTDYAREKGVLYTYAIGIVERDGVLIPESDINGIVEDVWAAVERAARSLVGINY
ncbi:hypothetical protein K1T71_011659 [Dendrolimus kikuchii]|uniref:Uncharacterized protein n=1 Tax=Dendrolimus kikuchii TaxID=765133 RepID=A0ACC1CLP8_9NEOP|nr:hypothetical protein K1T71_011659 [Dendrolimus kikuchii]